MDVVAANLASTQHHSTPHAVHSKQSDTKQAWLSKHQQQPRPQDNRSFESKARGSAVPHHGQQTRQPADGHGQEQGQRSSAQQASHAQALNVGAAVFVPGGSGSAPVMSGANGGSKSASPPSTADANAAVRSDHPSPRRRGGKHHHHGHEREAAAGSGAARGGVRGGRGGGGARGGRGGRGGGGRGQRQDGGRDNVTAPGIAVDDATAHDAELAAALEQQDLLAFAHGHTSAVPRSLSPTLHPASLTPSSSHLLSAPGSGAGGRGKGSRKQKLAQARMDGSSLMNFRFAARSQPAPVARPRHQVTHRFKKEVSECISSVRACLTSSACSILVLCFKAASMRDPRNAV